MYRSMEDIKEALLNGDTTLSSIRSSICRYRRLCEVETVLLYTEAVEWYLYETKYKPKMEDEKKAKNTV